MLEDTDTFFQTLEDDGESSSSSSSSSSVESLAFPHVEDISSDYTSTESMSIVDPAWNRSILNLFEPPVSVFGEDVLGMVANVGCPISSGSKRQNNTTTFDTVYGQGVSNPHPFADMDDLSNILSDDSTFCFDEAMIELSGCEAVECDETLHVQEKSDEMERIETKADFTINEKKCDFVELVEKAGKNVDSGAFFTPEAMEECNFEQPACNQTGDFLQDSGLEDIDDTVVDSSQPTEKSERHKRTLERIVELLQQIERSINEGIPLSVRKRPTWKTCTLENGILQSSTMPPGERIIKPIECRRLQLMVRLLGYIYQLLVTGTSCTKRELYYLNVELGQSPAYTYAALEDVCTLLNVDAWEVNVFNTSKGLIAGALVIRLACGRTVDCNARWGTSVPLDVGSVVELQIGAQLVLVVEKDTVFKRLLEDGILDKFPKRLLLVTGKGYPDVSTRLLLRKIANWSDVPIFGLMDADPHGIEILCVYKFGSLAMAYQQQSLAIPTMRWVGLLPSDIELLGLQGVPLREAELKKIEYIMKRPYTEGIIQRELMLLRQLAMKAEIESLYDIASDFVVTVYLPQKLKKLKLL